MNGVFRDKRILVTGGTGTIGRALVERILSNEHGAPRSVWVMSRGENKQGQMAREVPDPRLRFLSSDIRSYAAVCDALTDIDIVFHTAAMKDVPICERMPSEAVETNIGGAQNIVRAIRHHRLPVDCVIGCSTDKAADPVSVMGMTKFIQERIFINANGNGTRFALCRFGNIMGSRGSVLPIWRQQIAEGKTVTVTDPEMTRFFMTVRQAVEILIEAAAWAKPGDIFIPVLQGFRVGHLAQVLVTALGGQKGTTVTGARPGERMHEVLMTPEECGRSLKCDGRLYAVGQKSDCLQSGIYVKRLRSDDAERMVDADQLRSMLQNEGLL